MAVGREKLLREQTLVLRSQTFSDGLTGVANRRHFDVAMDKETRRAKRNGRSMEEEVRDILRAAVHKKEKKSEFGLGTELAALFPKTGPDFVIEEFHGDDIEPMTFDE